ncbi:MAG: hypothetical protein RLO81_09730 [Fulvivirga sp.]|uniref:hypothetical protein n=1 Tax=Fulvivirga sp. TaxID=1931237 RepID=UPI0032F03A00
MELISREELITQSDSKQVTLTTKRIRFKHGKTISSIMLNKVSGILVKYSSQPIYLIVSIISFIAGIGLMSETDGTGSIILFAIGMISLLIFLGTRRYIISIASSSTSIHFRIKGMSSDNVQKFINQVEQAIDNYKRT